MSAHRSEGQALIWMAMLMTLMLGFAALAVDVGLIYSERRKMQNAADAGALAGAQEVCLGRVGQAETKALEYAIGQNGAQAATVDIQDGVVTVAVSENVDTFLAAVVGLPEFGVGAQAAAACGNAKRGCGFWPIALGYEIWERMKPPDCETEGSKFVVIDSDKICGTDYDCDSDGDGLDDIFMGGGRGWLDLPWPDDPRFSTPCQKNCGEDKMQCYIENDYPGWIDVPGACILSEQGTMDSAFKAAGAQAGRTVGIPIFDGECSAASALGDCGGNKAYHIISIACVDVIEYDKKYPVYDLQKEKWTTEKALIVRASCTDACYKACRGTAGGQPGPGDTKGVSLLH